MSFFGSQNKLKQVPALSGGQNQFLEQLMAMLSGQGAQGGQEALSYLTSLISGQGGAYNAIEQGARDKFQSQTIPSILERFSGAGARSSSGLQQTLGQAGRGLESDLAGQRAQMQSGAVDKLLASLGSLGGLGLGTKPFGYQQIEGSPGILGYGMQGLGKGLGSFAGGGAGGGISGLLSLLSTLMGKQ